MADSQEGTITIYKYPFPIRDQVAIEMPEGAKVLRVGLQRVIAANAAYDQPVLWAQVNTAAPTRIYRFLLFGTGHLLPHEELEHVATFDQGPFVWHMFVDPS